MAATVTWDLLRDLAGFRAGRGCAVSLYLNLDPSEVPTAPAVETRINSLLSEAERQMDASRGELSRDAREGLKTDLDRIRRWFDDEFDRDGSQGAAVFASGPDNFWSAHNLPEPVSDGVRVNKQLYLAPLVRLVGSGDGAFVAFVGRERGQVYRMRGGRLIEVADQTEDTPGRHDQGGWSQARYERHIETLVERHLKRVAEMLDQCVRRLRDVHVVIVGSGSEEIRSEFDSLLSNEVKERLVGWTQAEAHATPAELLEAAEPVLDGARAGKEDKAVERWREEAGRNGRATSGWKDTLEAASDGRIELLLAQEGADRRAYQCPACGRAQADDGSCPLDGTAMEGNDHGLDLAVHQTLAHGGTIQVVRRRRDLDPVEGIGALLRY